MFLWGAIISDALLGGSAISTWQVMHMGFN
jgi:hypothetical protein